MLSLFVDTLPESVKIRKAVPLQQVMGNNLSKVQYGQSEMVERQWAQLFFQQP